MSQQPLVDDGKVSSRCAEGRTHRTTVPASPPRRRYVPVEA